MFSKLTEDLTVCSTIGQTSAALTNQLLNDPHISLYMKIQVDKAVVVTALLSAKSPVLHADKPIRQFPLYCIHKNL